MGSFSRGRLGAVQNQTSQWHSLPTLECHCATVKFGCTAPGRPREKLPTSFDASEQSLFNHVCNTPRALWSMHLAVGTSRSQLMSLYRLWSVDGTLLRWHRRPLIKNSGNRFWTCRAHEAQHLVILRRHHSPAGQHSMPDDFEAAEPEDVCTSDNLIDLGTLLCRVDIQMPKKRKRSNHGWVGRQTQ